MSRKIAHFAKNNIGLPPLVLALAVLLAAAQPVAAGVNFAFGMDAGQQVPRSGSRSSGFCTAVLEVPEGEGSFDEFPFAIACNHNLGDAATSAAIRSGLPGETGPALLTFDDAEELQAHVVLDTEEAVRMITGGYYVEVRTMLWPRGEIRGQIRAVPPLGEDRTLLFDLAPDQVVPPVTSNARGQCFASVPMTATDFFIGCVHDVANPVSASLRRAPTGSEGPVVAAFSGAESPLLIEVEDAMALEDLRTGDLYLEVTSASNPDGEIRGQVTGCVAGEDALCLADNRFRVEVTWRDFSGNTGAGTAVPQAADSGLFWFFAPDNTEVLVKVLDACAPPFNHFWVFYAATTNVEFELTVTDTERGVSKTYANDLGQTAETTLDTSAFDTCP
jgi:hypothetical protein